MLFSHWIQHLFNGANSESLLTILFGLCMILLAKAIRRINWSAKARRDALSELVPTVVRRREPTDGLKLPATPPPAMIKSVQQVHADLQ
jgi:hypothetical protein